jgi:hypothetical protein
MLSSVYLPLESIFPDDSKNALSDFLAGVSPVLLMKFCTAYANKGGQVLDRKGISKFFKEWFSSENETLMLETVIPSVWNFWDNLPSGPVRISIVNSESTLRLFEYSLSHTTNYQPYSNAELEVRILKAYLHLNSKLSDRDRVAEESTKDLDGFFTWYARVFAQQLPSNDINNVKLFNCLVCQCYKSIKLIEYLYKSEHTRRLCDALFKKYGCSDSKSLLELLLPLATLATSPTKDSFIEFSIPEDSSTDALRLFIKSNCLEISAAQNPKDDFVRIRQSPLVEQENGAYRIVFPKFLIERIYNGLVWGDLRQLNSDLKVFKAFPELLSDLGDNFTEKVLLNDTLNTFLPDQGIFLTGKAIEQVGFNGGSDGYFRNGKEVVLFECKDFSFTANVKKSGDFRIYIEELKKKLVANENGRDKAIRQILRNAMAILKGEFSPDKEIPDDVTIQPIIVLGNSLFDCPGIQQVANQMFSDELLLLKAPGCDLGRIKPPIVIVLDTLILFQDYLAQKTVPFLDHISEYTSFLDEKKEFASASEKESWLRSTFEPFSFWMEKRLAQLVKTNRLSNTPVPRVLSELLDGLIGQQGFSTD